MAARRNEAARSVEYNVVLVQLFGDSLPKVLWGKLEEDVVQLWSFGVGTQDLSLGTTVDLRDAAELKASHVQ